MQQNGVLCMQISFSSAASVIYYQSQKTHFQPHARLNVQQSILLVVSTQAHIVVWMICKHP